MSKRAQAKIVKGSRNDERKNGKAWGSGKTRGAELTSLQLVLMGKGMAHKKRVVVTKKK